MPAHAWASAAVHLTVSGGECGQAIGSVGTQAGTLVTGPVGLAQKDALKGMTVAPGGTALRVPLQVAPFRLNQATAGTLYLNGAVKFTTTSALTPAKVAMQGVLWARRVR